MEHIGDAEELLMLPNEYKSRPTAAVDLPQGKGYIFGDLRTSNEWFGNPPTLVDLTGKVDLA